MPYNAQNKAIKLYDDDDYTIASEAKHKAILLEGIKTKLLSKCFNDC